MQQHRTQSLTALLLAMLLLPATILLRAQDDESRGRKYKPPPPTGHIGVQVVKASNGKPIMNAAVVFHPVKDGKDEGNLEVKTDPDGKATIDVIPVGSKVEVQVIANGFATYAEDFTLTDAAKEIEIKLIRPRSQVSTYKDNSGKSSELKPGIQEPDAAARAAAEQPTGSGATPAAAPAQPPPAAKPNW